MIQFLKFLMSVKQKSRKRTSDLNGRSFYSTFWNGGKRRSTHSLSSTTCNESRTSLTLTPAMSTACDCTHSRQKLTQTSVKFARKNKPTTMNSKCVTFVACKF